MLGGSGLTEIKQVIELGFLKSGPIHFECFNCGGPTDETTVELIKGKPGIVGRTRKCRRCGQEFMWNSHTEHTDILGRPMSFDWISETSLTNDALHIPSEREIAEFVKQHGPEYVAYVEHVNTDGCVSYAIRMDGTIDWSGFIERDDGEECRFDEYLRDECDPETLPKVVSTLRGLYLRMRGTDAPKADRGREPVTHEIRLSHFLIWVLSQQDFDRKTAIVDSDYSLVVRDPDGKVFDVWDASDFTERNLPDTIDKVLAYSLAASRLAQFYDERRKSLGKPDSKELQMAIDETMAVSLAFERLADMLSTLWSEE